MATIPGHVADGQTIATAWGNLVSDGLQEHENEINDATTGNAALGSRVSTLESGRVPNSRTISTTNGLQGGGDLSANRTLSPVYGTAANTVAQGNDSRITVTQDGTIGNSALGSRVSALEANKSVKYVTRVVLTADQANNMNAAYYKVVWPTASPNSGFTWNANKDAFTVPFTGWYDMGLSMRFDGMASPTATNSERSAWVSLASSGDATRVVWATNTGIPRANEWPKMSDSQPVFLTAGDVYSVWTYQNSGGTLNLKSFGGACALNIAYLGS